MAVLIISDYPKKKLFNQIILLKKAIQKLNREVDLLTFSKGHLTFCNGQNSRNNSLKLFEEVLNEKRYEAIAISLQSENFEKLFSGFKFFKILRKKQFETRVFLFGSSKYFHSTEAINKSNFFHYPRAGVAKVSIAFKEDLLKYLMKSA